MRTAQPNIIQPNGHHDVDCDDDDDAAHDGDDRRMLPPTLTLRILNLAAWGEWNVAPAKYVCAELEISLAGTNRRAPSRNICQPT